MQLSLIRPLLKNNVALLVQYGAGAAVPLLVVPRLARTLGLEAFGALSMMLAWATYATSLVHYAFHLTGPARAAREPGRVAHLVAAVLQGRILLFAAAVTTLGLVHAVGGIPSSTFAATFVVLVLLPLAAALETTWHLQVRDRFIHTAALSVAGTALAVWFGFHFVQGPDAGSIAWGAAALVAGAVTVGAGSLMLSLLALGRLPVEPWREVWGALREGRPLFASQLVALAYGGSGPIIIGWTAGVDQAGIYAVLARVVMSLCVAGDLAHTAAYPTLAELYGRDRPTYLRLVRTVVLGYMAVAATTGVLGWAFRESVLAYLYGPRGAEMLSLYCLGLLWLAFGSFGGVITGYFAVSGQARLAYRLNLVVMGVSLAIGVPGAILGGAAGWLAGLLAGQIVIALVAVRHWNREHGPMD